MHGLEKGINQLAEQETNQKVRKTAIDLLNGIIDDLNAGIGVWNDLLSKGIPQSETGGYGGWAGFTIETKLFELELDARDKAKQASNGHSSLDDPLVTLAYGKLSEGQSAEDAARGAVSTMEERIKRLKSLISTIENTKPKKPAAAKKAVKAKASPAKKKPAKKKTASKKAVKKKPAAKKAAKKKATKKKAVKKKAATKKKATKKKAVKKKATKKKAVKKKPTKKKAAKKKAPTKKATKKKAVKKKKTKRR
ncbi:MAG: hypothetical protein PVJ39_10585 [Gammaproteobacteria bacterium]|jgi:hypothetical protein